MKAKCRCVFITDWHFNKLGRFFADHLKRQKKAIRKGFLYALENGIKNVIVGGDISEDPVLDGPALTALFEILAEFDGKLNIYIILGNHDFAHVEENSLQPLIVLCRTKNFKTIRVYDKPTHVVIDGVDFNMLPYPFVAKDKVYKGVSVNVAHLEWVGAMRDNGKSKITEGYTVNVKGKTENEKDFWLIGHLHTKQYLPVCRVLYSGTQFQTNFGENADKSFVDVTFQKKGKELKVDWQFIDADPGFVLENLKIETTADLAKVEKSRSHLYKLWTAPGVKVPKNFLIEYPNVIDLKSSVKGGIEETDEANVADLPTIGLTDGLRDRLKARGFKKADRNRAFEILKEEGITSAITRTTKKEARP